MMMQAGTAADPCFISPRLLMAASLTPLLTRAAREMAGGAPGLVAPVTAGFASEFLSNAPARQPSPGRARPTRYLAVIDVPEPALMRLPTALELRRPEYRLHVTRDVGVVRRLVVASRRDDPRMGVVDAYLLDDALAVLTGDFEIRSFPVERVPELAALGLEERQAFEIDPDGAYLHWPAPDIHLGVSQLLQCADPAYLVDIEIERNSNDFLGTALRSLREERGLRQVDVPGLGERQVRRIEEGLSRLRPASAGHFAAAFGMTVSDLLAEIGRRSTRLRNGS